MDKESSTKYANLPYRPGVGIVLLNEHKHIFIGRRINVKSNAWQMPQGGIDEGETAEEAVLRELEEEIGTGKAEIIKASQDWFSYDIPEYLIPRLWGGQYRGQRQKWFALRFLGSDADINIHTEHPEFEDWKWEKHETLVDVVVPFKQQLYQAVLNEFETLFTS